MTGGKLVKVCGMTRREDVDACCKAGVDMLGFIFHPASPRNVAPEFPFSLGRLPVKKVGVFVKQTADEVLSILAAGGLDGAQLHGNQDEAFCERIAGAIGRENVLRVFWPEKHASRAELEAELARFAPTCGLFLLDAGTSGGGHGRSMDFTRLANLAAPRPWLIAGGLTPDNVSEALTVARPDGLDLNSGLESAPGMKDHAKLAAAISKIAALGT